MTSTAPAAPPRTPAETPKTPQRPVAWWMPSRTGAALGLVAAALSVTPSLLPRPALLQGALAAVAFGLGYLLGVGIAALVRRRLPKQAARTSDRWWLIYAAAWVLALSGLSTLAVAWQNEVRGLVSMPPLEAAGFGGFLLGFLPLTAVLLLAGKGVHAAFRALSRRTSPVWGGILTTAGVILSVTALMLIVLAAVDRIYDDRNARPSPDAVAPASTFRSAGTGSQIAWESLGRHGADFVGGGPTAAEIEALTGTSALEPIRVYAGLASAPTAQERADLIVAELERTGAFAREVLVVATTTGSGWLEPQTVDAIEFLHGGNTAIAAMQYAYTPSWVSFVFDPDAPVDAARVLFDTVAARWEQEPADERPTLLVYGLSLGAHGGQSVFTDIEDLRARTDGALFVGSPNGSPLWRTLQAQRDEGSPVWRPVREGGREVRWMSRAGDETLLTGPWDDPRVLYLQHATDPVTWLSPELLWQKPEWLEDDQRSADISPAMRWIPLVTGLQVTVDMLMGEAVPASYGHNYGDVVVTAWQQIAPSSGVDAAAVARIQAKIESYAPIARYGE